MPAKAARDDGKHDVLFLDNGGYEIKALYLPQHGTPRTLVIPNCVGAASYAGRGIVGAQINQLPHYHGFLVRRPISSGFIIDGVLQAHIWEYVLEYFSIEDEAGVALWLTVPFGAPKAVAQLLYALLTQRFHFYAVTFVSSTFLALLAYNSHKACANTEAGHTMQTRHALKRPRSSDMPKAGQKSEEEVETRGNGTDNSAAERCSRGPGCAIVVDVGFSGTTVVPYIDGIPVYSSILRLSVGGKLLTNRLNEHLSFTQVNLLADGWLVNHIKEQCCAFALQPRHELDRLERMRIARLPNTKTTISSSVAEPQAKDRGTAHYASAKQQVDSEMHEIVYMLPTIPALYPLGCVAETKEVQAAIKKACKDDKADEKEGDVTEDSLQTVKLLQERYLVPELLFTPRDVGLEEQGLAEAIRHGIFARGLLYHLPLLRRTLLSNVCVFGGSSRIPHFHARLASELEVESIGESNEGGGVTPYHATLLATKHDIQSSVQRNDMDRDQNDDCLASTNPVYTPLQGAHYLLTAKEAEGYRNILRSRSELQLRRHGLTALDIHQILQRIL